MTQRTIIAISGLLALLVIGFAVAGTLNSPKARADAAPAATASPTVVLIQNFAFAPAKLTITTGTTVVWKNLDTASHTATSLTRVWDTGNLDQGQSGSYTFTKAGTFDYVCNYHPSMTATIVVKDSGG